MPDLIIHIGFPKCASTSLQKLVFEDERGYVGAFRGIMISINFHVNSELVQRLTLGNETVFHKPENGRTV